MGEMPMWSVLLSLLRFFYDFIVVVVNPIVIRDGWVGRFPKLNHEVSDFFDVEIVHVCSFQTLKAGGIIRPLTSFA